MRPMVHMSLAALKSRPKLKLAPLVAGLCAIDNAAAQCAMCREAAAAQTAEGIAAFNLGILVLGAPPLLIMGLLAWALWRYRDGVPVAGSGSSSSS